MSEDVDFLNQTQSQNYTKTSLFETLSDNERILLFNKLHWIIWVKPIFWCLVSLIVGRSLIGAW